MSGSERSRQTSYTSRRERSDEDAESEGSRTKYSGSQGPDEELEGSASDSKRLSDAEKKAARRVQVRRAQILHRQRKANYTKQLEADVGQLQDLIAQTERDAASLRDENEAMRSSLYHAGGYGVPSSASVSVSASGSGGDPGPSTAAHWSSQHSDDVGHWAATSSSAAADMYSTAASGTPSLYSGTLFSNDEEQELFADVDINALVRRYELEGAMASSGYGDYAGTSGSGHYGSPDDDDTRE